METYYGVVRGNHIELDNEARLADGLRVEVRPQPTARDDADADAALLKRLRTAGLLENDPALPRRGPAPLDPVQVQGEPLSEQIIRERR